MSLQCDRIPSSSSPDSSSVSVEDAGVSVLVDVDGDATGRWASPAAVVTDLAAESIIAEELAGWRDTEVNQRSEMLATLRGFPQSCPSCAGVVVFERFELREDDPGGSNRRPAFPRPVEEKAYPPVSREGQ